MIAAILAGLFFLTAPVQAVETIRELGGMKNGCPMKLVYDPAVLRADPGLVPAYAAEEIQSRGEMELLEPLGVVQEPASGREWHLLYSLGMSCDPYFLFLSSGPAGKQRAELAGEMLIISSRKEFTLKDKFNLFFPIEKSIVWKDGRPMERIPDFYKVQKKTKALLNLPLYASPRTEKPGGKSIPAGKAVTVSGYLPAAGPDGQQDRALVRSADGVTGWIEVKDGVLADVSFHGD